MNIHYMKRVLNSNMANLLPPE